MSSQPLIIERAFDAPIASVWKALTERELMKQWYFDLPEFKVEVGFKFQFTGGHEDGIQYVHVCEILEVKPERLLKHSWVYQGYEGYSTVRFELFEEGDGTRLKLTHEGLDTFPSNNPDLAKENFVEGWIQIIGTSLKEFLEKQ
jgi:uncharacterized protein YndB with AHSA1/START domain